MAWHGMVWYGMTIYDPLMVVYIANVSSYHCASFASIVGSFVRGYSIACFSYFCLGYIHRETFRSVVVFRMAHPIELMWATFRRKKLRFEGLRESRVSEGLFYIYDRFAVPIPTGFELYG